MATELRIRARPELERPVLIAAFRGWNDGAQGASLAGGYLAKVWNAEQFADDYDYVVDKVLDSVRPVN